MELALVGVGHKGSRIVNQILAIEANTSRAFSHGNAVVFDISQTAPDELDVITDEQMFLIGDTHDQVTDNGVDGDADLAAEVTQTDRPEIRRALDSLSVHEADGILLVADLGSGTGSGAGSVITAELQEIYDEPVYVLGSLPPEAAGGQAALNAARALRSVVSSADSLITVDFETWIGSSSTQHDDSTSRDNSLQTLATRVVTLFAAGELDSSTIAENAVDSSDLIRTLEPGGIASIGYAATEVQPDTSGLLSRLFVWLGIRDDERKTTTDAAQVKALVRQAANSQLTVSCDIASAERALVVLSGPSSELSRRGFESARHWLEQATDTVEILAGDDPREQSSTVEVVVLFSNVTAVPRIDALQEQAVNYKHH
ncbi:MULTISPECIES: tubulin/FtsZ family protein [Halobacterium]|uniref:tubulin/FtsZ family protein n=1 Tax=Halobacterium TaxID=2239 RepID=UPI0009EAD9DB|nr:MULTISPECIES: tubulin/FtsZ family protein [Halobacterium]MCG1004957.1 tubulin/FtsZ family protein [Halobacterium noricense]